MAEEKLLTPVQVADRLQIHERTVTRWLRDGYLRGFKLGKEWRLAPADLSAFMEKHANQTLDTGSSSPPTIEIQKL
jgi:excisionase family DNA binding protein